MLQCNKKPSVFLEKSSFYSVKNALAVAVVVVNAEIIGLVPRIF
jgi:hypothetical protein